MKNFETCQLCGQEYPSVYNVSDYLWIKVTGRADGAGLLCMPCFEKEAAKVGIIPFWSCGDHEYPKLKEAGEDPREIAARAFCLACAAIREYKTLDPTEGSYLVLLDEIKNIFEDVPHEANMEAKP